jgi:hypothetical protein
MTDADAIHLLVALNQEEMAQYYEFEYGTSPRMRGPLLHLTAGVPIGIVILLLFIRPQGWVWAVSALVCAFWIFLLAPGVYRLVIRHEAEKKSRVQPIQAEPVEIEDKDAHFWINGAEQAVKTCTAFGDLLILGLEHQRLIVPSRSFADDEKKMECFVRDAMRASQGTKE